MDDNFAYYFSAILLVISTYLTHNRFLGGILFAAFAILLFVLILISFNRLTANKENSSQRIRRIIVCCFFIALPFGANYSYPYWGLDFTSKCDKRTIVERLFYDNPKAYTVYETPYGECYHRKNCYHISGHVIRAVDINDTDRRPCLDCNP